MPSRIFAKQLLIPRTELVRNIRDDDTRGIIEDVIRLIEDLWLDIIQQEAAGSRFLSFSATQSLTATQKISPNADVVRVQGSGGAITLTSNPSIDTKDGDGQLLYIKGMSNTNTLTLTDGNGMALGASSRTLGLNDILLMYSDPDTDEWHELLWSNLA